MNKNQNWRRVLSLLFAMVMLVSIMVVGTVVASAEETDVAKIGEQGYTSLESALETAADGDTVVLLADINEDVTVKKKLTIDGAGKNYTGTMTLNAGLTVTVKNVNFVNGGIAKTTKSSTGYYTIKDCTFDGNGTYAYPLLFKGAHTVTVENCTVSNYLYSFLYVPNTANTVKVKDVTVENCPNYAVYFASGVTNATFENLTVKNSNNGFILNNTATRSLTVKNCVMQNVGTAISAANGTSTIACTLIGANDFGTAAFSQYAKLTLNAVDATLKTDKADLAINIPAELKDAEYVPAYANGVWSVVLPVAEVNGVAYGSIQAAIDAAQPGDTATVVTLLKNVNFDGSEAVLCGNHNYANLVLADNKQIIFDFNGYKLNVNLTATNAVTTSNMLISVFFVQNGSELTFVDSSEEKTGGIYAVKGNYKLYCMIYNSKATVIIKSGNYVAEEVADSLVYADKENNTQIQGGFFRVGNYTIEKPWVSNVHGKDEGNFVVYTGGTFNHNPLVNDGTHKDCEVKVPNGYVVIANEDGTWSVIKAVAKVGDKYFESLKDAMDYCNEATGEYTITLVANVNESFSFAQKSGVKITIDGNEKQFAFYGKLTLKAGAGELVFANAVVEPKNSYTIYIADKTAPNVTFVSCELIGTNRSGTIIYGYNSSNNNTKFTVKDCDAHGLSYIISIRQGGYKVHVEDVTATHMAYVLRTLKCDSVYVKNLKATDVWVGIEVRNDGPSNTRTLTLENVEIEVALYNGEYISPVNGTLSSTNVPSTFNIVMKGNNYFTKDDGTSFEKTEWFQGNNGFKVIRTNIASASLLLNDKVGIYFNLDNSAVLDGYYAVITNKTTGETFEIPASDWNGNKILVTLAAKQMADELTVVIKWGDREISNTITTSISTYYKNGVNKGIFSDKDKALLEAMLHYGAQAQKAFGHNTANLANAGIAAVQNVTVENKMEGERYYGASLNLEDHVIFNFKFFAGGVNADYAVVTFADGSTKRIEFRDANGEYLPEILERNSANVLLYVIKLDDIDLADVADDITCTIYWAHGEGNEDDEAIHTATDSVLSYCARAMEGLANMKETNEEKYNGQKFKEDFYQALANYVAAVKGYAEDYEV